MWVGVVHTYFTWDDNPSRTPSTLNNVKEARDVYGVWEDCPDDGMHDNTSPTTP